MISPWAQEEVGAVDLGDQRLDARAAVLLSALGNRPNLSIPAACAGRAEMQAACRFFDNQKVTFDKILAPHVERTLQRISEQEVVLLVQDSSELELMRPQRQVQGVGELDGSRRGLLLHAMHAYTRTRPTARRWARCRRNASTASKASAMRRSRKSGRSASKLRSSKKRACVGSAACGGHAKSRRNCRRCGASVCVTAKRIFTNCSPSRAAWARASRQPIG
jgi:hypothetical protein